MQAPGRFWLLSQTKLNREQVHCCRQRPTECGHNAFWRGNLHLLMVHPLHHADNSGFTRCSTWHVLTC